MEKRVIKLGAPLPRYTTKWDAVFSKLYIKNALFYEIFRVVRVFRGYFNPHLSFLSPEPNNISTQTVNYSDTILIGILRAISLLLSSAAINHRISRVLSDYIAKKLKGCVPETVGIFYKG